MTSLLPSGMQVRTNLSATGVAVDRIQEDSNYTHSLSFNETEENDWEKSVGFAPSLALPSRKGPSAHSKGGQKVQDNENILGDGQHVTAGQEDGRDISTLLARLSKSPDSKDFVYLRSYLPDANAVVSERLTPLNPYHIEVVPHSEV